jgi:hypothetical protein
VAGAELALEDLAGAGDRECIDEVGAARRLVAGDEALAVRPELPRRRGRAGPQDDGGVDALPPPRVRHPDDHAGRDGRVAGERVLDFRGVDVLPTGDDHVLDAVDDEDVPLVAHPPAVAGQPSPLRSHTQHVPGESGG